MGNELFNAVKRFCAPLRKPCSAVRQQPCTPRRFWSAVTCHRFGGFTGLSVKQDRVQRLAEKPAPFLDGDESPAKSADKSAHSKAIAALTRE
jgi:hypothetical protein